MKICFATFEFLTGQLLKSTSLWTLDLADGKTMILRKSVNLSQSTWHTIQEEWNFQIFILPSIICINLRTKACYKCAAVGCDELELCGHGQENKRNMVTQSTEGMVPVTVNL